MGNVNMYASRLHTKDGFCNLYKNMCHNASVTVALVNEDGTDSNCKFTVNSIDELIHRITTNGEWHIIRDFGEEVPDLYKMMGRENEYQRYEHLYVFALSIN